MSTTFVPNPTACALTIVYSVGGNVATNTLYIDFGNVPTVSDVTEAAEEFANMVGDLLPPVLTNTVALVGVRARSLASDLAPVSEYTYPSPLTGFLGILHGSPSQAALVLTLRTGLAGRSGRGRVYVPGVERTGEASDYANPIWAQGVQSAFEEIRTSVAEDQYLGPLVVYSRYHNNEPRTTGLMIPVVQVALRNTRIDSQRRRMPAQ